LACCSYPSLVIMNYAWLVSRECVVCSCCCGLCWCIAWRLRICKCPAGAAVRQFLEGSPDSPKSVGQVQIRGVVTALWGDRAFFVQDDTGGLFAFRDQADASLQVHDSVLLTGTAATGGSTRHLRVTNVEVLGRGGESTPTRTTAGESTEHGAGRATDSGSRSGHRKSRRPAESAYGDRGPWLRDPGRVCWKAGADALAAGAYRRHL
jgi:hypothetical protein